MLKLTASVSYPNLIAGISLNNTINAIIISGFALGIKFSKKWYLQQQLNLTLAKEKKNRELQLLKARIQPSFLFETLHAIRENLPDTKKAIILVVKLSDLLSYTLYECNTPNVLLTRELKCAKNFLFLADAGMQNKITLKINAADDITDVVIIPMVLISFLQNCVLFINKNIQQVAHTDLFLSIKRGRLRFEFSIKCRNYQPGQWQSIIDDASARLNADYSRNFSIEKIYKDPELNITLELLLTPPPLVAV
jgi:LytS/YehU family sensor histidine kinase